MPEVSASPQASAHQGASSNPCPEASGYLLGGVSKELLLYQGCHPPLLTPLLLLLLFLHWAGGLDKHHPAFKQPRLEPFLLILH